MAEGMRQRKGGEAEQPAAEFARKQQSTEEQAMMFETKFREAMEQKCRSEAGKNDSEADIRRKVDEGMSKLFEPKKKPLPGLSNKTKAAKDALTDDPYNLDNIFELGEAYIEEEKWTEASNVLIRGWKRVSEITDPNNRFLYLYQLCTASTMDSKWKQAAAVLQDMEEPTDDNMKTRFACLQCKVYGHNDNLQKSLKAFHTAIEKCTTIDEALPIYLDCSPSLRQVGAHDAAKSAMEKLAKEDDDLKKLQAAEFASTMKEALNVQPGQEEGEPINRKIICGVIGVALAVVLYALYLLEMKSLREMKLAQ